LYVKRLDYLHEESESESNVKVLLAPKIPISDPERISSPLAAISPTNVQTSSDTLDNPCGLQKPTKQLMVQWERGRRTEIGVGREAIAEEERERFSFPPRISSIRFVVVICYGGRVPSKATQ
jgi:hypothetical protein